MSKCDIRHQFECQNRILNVKIDIWPQFECQNTIRGLSSNVKRGFECQNTIFRPNLDVTKRKEKNQKRKKEKQTIFTLLKTALKVLQCV